MVDGHRDLTATILIHTTCDVIFSTKTIPISFRKRTTISKWMEISWLIINQNVTASSWSSVTLWWTWLGKCTLVLLRITLTRSFKLSLVTTSTARWQFAAQTRRILTVARKEATGRGRIVSMEERNGFGIRKKLRALRKWRINSHLISTRWTSTSLILFKDFILSQSQDWNTLKTRLSLHIMKIKAPRKIVHLHSPRSSTFPKTIRSTKNPRTSHKSRQHSNQEFKKSRLSLRLKRFPCPTSQSKWNWSTTTLADDRWDRESLVVKMPALEDFHGWAASLTRTKVRFIRQKAWKWINAIFLDFLSASGRISYRCAGSLISDRYVLTAGHCVSNLVESLEL